MKQSKKTMDALSLKRRNVLKERGKERNKGVKSSLLWDASQTPNLKWAYRFSIPYSSNFSKNSTHLSNRQGGRFMRKESRDIKDSISEILAYSEAKKKVVQNKVWIDVLVQKPSNRGDAVNVIDLVCDAVEAGLGINDKWFSIRRLDWEIVKENPQVFIGVGQEDVEPVEICNHCGRLLPFDFFQKRKGKKGGVGRDCKECRLKEYN